MAGAAGSRFRAVAEPVVGASCPGQGTRLEILRGWKAACPLSVQSWKKRPFVQDPREKARKPPHAQN
jgi:hypothetical protein